MFVKTVALLAAHPINDPNAPTQDPCLWKIDGQTFLDWQILKLKEKGLQPFLVLGQNGDELLLNTRAAQEIDLVFDSANPTDLSSQIWASLSNSSSGLFLLPVTVPCPEIEIWQSLDKASNALTPNGQTFLYRESDAFSLKPADLNNASTKIGPLTWPLLIRQKAIKKLQKVDSSEVIVTLESTLQQIPMPNEAEAPNFLQNQAELDLWNKKTKHQDRFIGKKNDRKTSELESESNKPYDVPKLS